MNKLNKRLFLLLLVVNFIIYGTNIVTVSATTNGGKPPKGICVEEFEKKRKEFDNKVLKDIVKSYNLDLSGYQEFTHADLNLKVGDKLNEHSDKISLQHLFVGTSNGSMRLFLEKGLKGKKGYFLYKRIDGNNVKKELYKTGSIWVVMSVDEVQANMFELKPFDWEKCSKN
ncbi:hypothetical protein ACFSFW_19315 [Fredinandcohnia salidurans]|uniref:Uncharacterized protein n=1 Tax=Fredinandcohnia salidurans TaxID=2595041 RepID=A0ABW4MT68_9BACI